MRKFLLALLLWLSPFIAFLSVVSACSESEKKVASGYTEEQNAWDIKDTVAYLKLLKTWEPEIPVDSVQRKPEINGAPEDVYWYDIRDPMAQMDSVNCSSITTRTVFAL